MIDKKLCIFGAGGFAKEVYTIVIAAGLKNKVQYFIESDEIWHERKVLGLEVIPLSGFNHETHKIIIAVGDPLARKKIVNSLPEKTEYFTLIHPNAILSDWVEIGEGSIICAGCILTCDITIGKHAHINLDCTIGHDCMIGDFLTASPSVNISGHCNIGNCVYLGTNASIREKITISSNITVGMGGIVLKDLTESGTYVGIPVRKISG